MKRWKQQIPMGCGMELEAFSRWRRWICIFDNSTGVVKGLQRQYNKRERKLAKQELEYEDGG